VTPVVDGVSRAPGRGSLLNRWRSFERAMMPE